MRYFVRILYSATVYISINISVDSSSDEISAFLLNGFLHLIQRLYVT
jgi:hypothetical protein